MAAAPSLANLKFDNSLGAMLIGGFIATTLFGLTTLQTYLYYFNYPNDRPTFKWLVGATWIIDFLSTALMCHALYYFLVSQFGNPLALLRGEWSIIVEVAVTEAMILLVHGFFAHRVYRLTHNNYFLAGVVVVLSIAHAGLALTAVVKLFQIKVFARLPEVMGVMSATLITMAVNDVFITAVLCLFLRRTQTNFSQTQSAVGLLIVYTIETGLLTSVIATIDAICILTMPHNWVFIGVTFCLSKFYANSFLTILNSRHSLQKADGSSYKISVSSGGRQSRMRGIQDMSMNSFHKPTELSPELLSGPPARVRGVGNLHLTSSPDAIIKPPHDLAYAV